MKPFKHEEIILSLELTFVFSLISLKRYRQEMSKVRGLEKRLNGGWPYILGLSIEGRGFRPSLHDTFYKMRLHTSNVYFQDFKLFHVVTSGGAMHFTFHLKRRWPPKPFFVSAHPLSWVPLSQTVLLWFFFFLPTARCNSCNIILKIALNNICNC